MQPLLCIVYRNGNLDVDRFSRFNDDVLHKPGVGQQETTYLASLGRAATFTITGDRLSLADTMGKTLVSFTKKT